MQTERTTRPRTKTVDLLKLIFKTESPKRLNFSVTDLPVNASPTIEAVIKRELFSLKSPK